MKKKFILILITALLTTSCGILSKLGKTDTNGDDTTTDTDTNTGGDDNNKTDKYEDCKDYEWYGIGLEVYTNYLGNNIYYESLKTYELARKGKYTVNDDSIGHVNLFLCDNGDVVVEDVSDDQYLDNTQMFVFDKSEYAWTTLTHKDRCYDNSPIGYTPEEAKLSYYLKLAMEFPYFIFDNMAYTDIHFATLDNVYSVYGIMLQLNSIGTVEKSDDMPYMCSSMRGYGPTYSDMFVFTRYMNSNPMFNFIGIPPFMSLNNLKSWDYDRGYFDYRGYRHWIDKYLTLSFTGYTYEDVASWLPLFELAGYHRKTSSGTLNEDCTYFSYEAAIDILGYNTKNSDTPKYLTNTMKLTYFSLKRDENNKPTDFVVQYRIEFQKVLINDMYGQFIFQDTGLYLYYTDQGERLYAKIINTSGEIETEVLQEDDDRIISFFFPHVSIDIGG